VAGTGTVISYTVNHQAWLPGMIVPYTIILVEFDDAPGVRLTANFANPATEAHIGQKVSVKFHQREDVWIPQFVPIEERAA
jgi:Predicted nucleic-acid-binding protein containing a Zn-ribbon